MAFLAALPEVLGAAGEAGAAEGAAGAAEGGGSVAEGGAPGLHEGMPENLFNDRRKSSGGGADPASALGNVKAAQGA